MLPIIPKIVNDTFPNDAFSNDAYSWQKPVSLPPTPGRQMELMRTPFENSQNEMTSFNEDYNYTYESHDNLAQANHDDSMQNLPNMQVTNYLYESPALDDASIGPHLSKELYDKNGTYNTYELDKYSNIWDISQQLHPSTSIANSEQVVTDSCHTATYSLANESDHLNKHGKNQDVSMQNLSNYMFHGFNNAPDNIDISVNAFNEN